ncbi:MAG: TonB-dependent receptor, partial [Gammaproteobacteria bacterium]|nr:TonB-dependent receptor [Gammaproteobacteria bacterium]MDB6106736.1 TonB-dependent receptor [Gammaproteobacteria bacterium]
VTNIGDKQPPIMYSNNVLNSNTDVQTYDTLGRRFFLSVQQKF